MIYNVSGFKTTNYDEAKALNKPFTIEFENVKETTVTDEDKDRIVRRTNAILNKRKGG